MPRLHVEGRIAMLLICPHRPLGHTPELLLATPLRYSFPRTPTVDDTQAIGMHKDEVV